jgi:hypothetical protein
MASYQIQRTRIARMIDPTADLPDNFYLTEKNSIQYNTDSLEGPVSVVSAQQEDVIESVVVARMIGLKKTQDIVLEGFPAVVSEDEEIINLPLRLKDLKNQHRIRKYECKDEDNCVVYI